MSCDSRQTLGALLFEDFELLDAFGPLELFGLCPEHLRIITVAERHGVTASAQGPRCAVDHCFDDCPRIDVLLVPGGRGTRRQVTNGTLLAWLQSSARSARLLASVCTGASLLAAAGLLDGKRATTNKLAFRWVTEQGPRVQWVAKARWIEDTNIFTAAGVSAGMDMALGVISRMLGPEEAERVANEAEYDWHRDPSWDPFARQAGLS